MVDVIMYAVLSILSCSALAFAWNTKVQVRALASDMKTAIAERDERSEIVKNEPTHTASKPEQAGVIYSGPWSAMWLVVLLVEKERRRAVLLRGEVKDLELELRVEKCEEK